MSDATPFQVGPQPPYLLAFIVCDAIYIDPSTGKRSLLGIISAFQANDFPAIVPQMVIYASFSDGRGKIPIKLKLTTVDEESEPLFQGDIEVECNDPRTVYDMVLAVQNIKFPAAGEYRLHFYACGEFLMERRIIIVGPPSGETHDSGN